MQSKGGNRHAAFSSRIHGPGSFRITANRVGPEATFMHRHAEAHARGRDRSPVSRAVGGRKPWGS